MTVSTKDRKDTLKNAQTVLRRSALAYVGFYGWAWDRAVQRHTKNRDTLNAWFGDLVAKGEDVESRAEVLFKGTQMDMLKQYADASEKVHAGYEDITKSVSRLVPSFMKKEQPIEELEDQVAQMKKKVEALKKAKAAKPAKAMTTEKTKTTKAAPKKPAAKTETKPVAKKNAAPKTVKADVKTETKAPAATAKKAQAPKVDAKKADTPKADTQTAPTAKKAPAKREEPRHIPYFNDVKRYDPLADEAVVRKIVNHCGIALQSQDARYVACTDEAERNRVRESWMKKKLGLTGTDAELDKKVQNVCAVMQRDNLKNRVTFYYLVAKAERKLGNL